MGVSSNSRQHPPYHKETETLFVHDKETFRAWCRLYSLDIDQICILFDVSKPSVYKYIDMSSHIKVRKPIIINCNLISFLGRKQAESYLIEKLKNTKHPWPSPFPIGQ